MQGLIDSSVEGGQHVNLGNKTIETVLEGITLALYLHLFCITLHYIIFDITPYLACIPLFSLSAIAAYISMFSGG